jgi:hypothetical protein
MVRIELTEAEAVALWRAAGNSLTDEHTALDILLNKHSVKAAQRAFEKLGTAISHQKGS